MFSCNTIHVHMLSRKYKIQNTNITESRVQEIGEETPRQLQTHTHMQTAETRHLFKLS